MAVEVGEPDDELPQITLQEMMDDLHIGDPDPAAGTSILLKQ